MSCASCATAQKIQGDHCLSAGPPIGCGSARSRLRPEASLWSRRNGDQHNPFVRQGAWAVLRRDRSRRCETRATSRSANRATGKRSRRTRCRSARVAIGSAEQLATQAARPPARAARLRHRSALVAVRPVGRAAGRRRGDGVDGVGDCPCNCGGSSRDRAHVARPSPIPMISARSRVGAACCRRKRIVRRRKRVLAAAQDQ